MARVRCLTIARDGAMLDAWIRYHAYQFGFSSLTIFTGASSTAGPVLERATSAGAEVRSVAEVAVEELHSLVEGEATTHDFVAPLACDEFLAVQTNDGVSCRRDRIHAAFAPLLGEWRALSYAPGLVSVSGQQNEFAVVPIERSVLPAGAAAAGRRGTALTCLSFANLPNPSGVRVIFQGLANLLDALGVNDDRLGVPAVTPRAGPDATIWVRSDAAGRAVRFKASAYWRAHEDVAKTGWPPFMHYVSFGLRERRQLG